MSDEEDFKVNSASHKKLLSEINDIVKFQHVRKPKRSEPSVKNDEFHLIKTKSLDTTNDENSTAHDKKNVTVKALANIVRKNEKQKKISNLFQDTFKKDKVLKKPLEKVYNDRIQRSIAYDNTKNKLSKWDAIVTRNKNAEQLKFPLNQDKAFIKGDNNNKNSGFSQLRYKSKMIQEMEEIHNQCFPKTEEPIVENDNELLTLEEMRERRKEMARLKIRESHIIVKKRLQGKIKSKKYHRLKKRDDLKKKLKEFEELKATNPEAALKELEKIDRQRIQERVNLRHKNTGTWAKNMKVRAEYDTTAKQEIEAQLALSRELTQKQQQMSSESESEEESPTNSKSTADNPWLSENNADFMDELFSGYRKIWEDKNANEKALRKLKNMEKPELEKANEEEESSDEEKDDLEEDMSESDGESHQNDSKSAWIEEDVSTDNDDPTNFINDLFDAAEENINQKLETKLKDLKPKLLSRIQQASEKKSKRKLKGKPNVHDPKYLEFQKNARIGDIDEALLEGENDDTSEHLPPSKKLAREIEEIKDEKKSFMRGTKDEIDPDSFLKIKSKHLLTTLPKNQEFDDADEEELDNLQASNKMSLAEAFENDDIIHDFIADIEEEAKSNQNNESSALPGWGHWAGEGVKNKKKFNEKKSTVKKKDRVIVNTAPHESLKKHLVSSVPFPFTTIKDFEASLRIPIGKDFIPSTAHSKLTMESVITKAGTIIEPMSEEALVKVQNEKKNHFKKRKFMKSKNNIKKMKKIVKT